MHTFLWLFITLVSSTRYIQFQHDLYPQNFTDPELKSQEFFEILRKGTKAEINWGDANIQALALKMFCSKDSQKKLPNFSYFHQSHNHLVET